MKSKNDNVQTLSVLSGSKVYEKIEGNKSEKQNIILEEKNQNNLFNKIIKKKENVDLNIKDISNPDNIQKIETKI